MCTVGSRLDVKRAITLEILGSATKLHNEDCDNEGVKSEIYPVTEIKVAAKVLFALM